MITIEQNPAGFMGSNMDHIFTISSTNTALTNFKFVIDVYFNPYETTAEKIGRIKVRPNTYGKAIFNVRDIIYNYIKPNPRADVGYGWSGPSFWTTSTYPNPNVNISFASGFTESNIKNGTSPYETLNHTGSYRILVGEEYESGGTTILNINTNYWVPTETSNFTESLDTAVGPPYGGVPNRINWTGANSWEDFQTGYGVYTSGYTYLHTTSAGSFIASGTSTADSGNYIAALEPSTNDLFYVWSNDLGCGYKFIWNCNTCETSGWNYVDTYSPTDTPICSSASDMVRLTPAAEPQNYVWSQGDAADYTTTGMPPFANTSYMFKFKLTQVLATGPGLDGGNLVKNFYNQFGNDKTPYSTNGITLNSINIENHFRHRQHHKNCPIVINFANGNLGDFPYWGQPVSNQVSGLVELRQTGNTLDYHTTWATPNSGTTQNIYTPLDSLITNWTGLYWGNAADLQDVKKVAFYTHKDGTSTNYTSNGTSNIYVFDLYGDECLYGDAKHFLYLNNNGAWDTITFGTKNIKSLSTSRDVYAQNGLKDASSYMWGSWEQRNITYNQDTQVSVEAQSAWVDENDVPNYRDFFLSNYVYEITQFLGENNTLITTLTPISITDTTFEEYKQRYNKLYQYNMNYVYNPIKQFNNVI